ncbi:MAG: hypothetical protein R3F62_23445 [Planctomycetota bacterium]
MRVTLLLPLVLTSAGWAGPSGPPFFDPTRKTEEQEEAADDAEKAAKQADVDEALALLGDRSVWVRDAVFEVLEERNDAQLLAGLAPHLAHKDPLVRAAVAELFGRCRFAAAREALERYGLGAKDPETVLESVWALERLGDAASAKPLEKLAKRGGKLGYRVQGDALIALAHLDPAAARELADKALEKPKGPLAIAALEALREADAQAAARAGVATLGALSDKDPWGPRILDAACAALRGWEARDDAALVAQAIEALIPLLEGSEGLTLHVLNQTLTDLAGVALPPQAEPWRGWWEAQREGFTPPKPGGVEPEEGETRVRYHGIPIHSRRVLFALDCSSGMTRHPVDEKDPESPLRLTFAVMELSRVLEALPDETLTNVIFFATQYRPMSAALVPMGKARRAMQKFVQAEAKTPDGKGLSRSNVYDTLTLALDDPRIDTIYLLSEGGPTEGRYRKRKRLLRHLKRHNLYSRVRVHVLQVAEGKKRTEFLEAVADDLGGRYYDLEFLRKAHDFK